MALRPRLSPGVPVSKRCDGWVPTPYAPVRAPSMSAMARIRFSLVAQYERNVENYRESNSFTWARRRRDSSRARLDWRRSSLRYARRPWLADRSAQDRSMTSEWGLAGRLRTLLPRFMRGTLSRAARVGNRKVAEEPEGGLAPEGIKATGRLTR